jgi:mono/diheme cytochrome c family protein
MNARLLSIALAGCLLLVACGGEESKSPTPVPSIAPAASAPTPAPAAAAPTAAVTPDAAKGATLYAANCASCHGPRGEGDGPTAAALVPKPAKHHDGAYMNALTNEHLFKVIKEGGPSAGKSPMMAPWGGMLGDAQIWDVVAFVRSLAAPPYAGKVP